MKTFWIACTLGLAASLAMPSSGWAGYSNIVLATPGLTDFFPLHETSGTTAANLATPGNPGSYLNSPTLGAATPANMDMGGGAMSVNGNQILATNLNIGLNFTIELWSKLSTTTWAANGQPWGRLVSYEPGVSSSGQIFLGGGSGNNTTITAAVGVKEHPDFNNYTTAGTAGNPGNLEQWHQYVLVYTDGVRDEYTTTNGRYLRIYEDGALLASAQVQWYQSITLGTLPVHFAGKAINDPTESISGLMTDISVYNTALDATTIASHFAAGTIPEPASLGLLALGSLFMLRRRRTR